jgi:uracil-DNA glycosylase
METGENTEVSPKIEASWKKALAGEFAKPYFAEIKRRLLEERQQGNSIFPPGKLIFNAFDSTPFDHVKVVIIGQDPYHGPGQAHGLSFSVPKGIQVPPSLQNIYKEIHQDLGLPIPAHGNLEKWADQGVLLLNSILTVRAHQAASHHGLGWEKFTDAAIFKLNRDRDGLVFMLWGNYAKQKGNMIDRGRHLILHAPHPSPLSAYNGWFGSKHFSQANAYLQAQGKAGIDWRVD